MNGREFYEKVNESDDLEWLGVTRNGDIAVEYLETGTKFVTKLEDILANSWDRLNDVFCGRASASVMMQITRVVGYYSRTANWNMSKVAELRDRHKGNYTLPEGKIGKIDATLPPEIVESLAASGAEMSCELVGAA